jgi:hypothetical protein
MHSVSATSAAASSLCEILQGTTAASPPDSRTARHRFAGVGFAARNHHLGAEPRHRLGAGAADAAARASHDRNFVAEIEWRRHV